MKHTLIILYLVTSCILCSAACPPADLTGDCDVNLEDLAVLASYWLCTGISEPEIVWVSIQDPGVSGHEPFLGKMCKYEITNDQYCQFLNLALSSGDIAVSGEYVNGAKGQNPGYDFLGYRYYALNGPGIDFNGAVNGGAARIHWNGSSFTVDQGFESHPVNQVTWYGATAFCNYFGYRLPTEWEWQAVADYHGTFIYGCGVTINNSMANYLDSSHPDGTTPVGTYGAYGHGICDLAGNVWEWTSSVYNSNYRVLCGGFWSTKADTCEVSHRHQAFPLGQGNYIGFRVVRAE